MTHTQATVPRQMTVALALLVTVALIAAVGSLATIPNTDGWYADAAKVPWNPPNAVFGPVWSVLYVMIAAAGWLLWRSGYRRAGANAARLPLTLFFVQLALNAAWTPVFFAGYPAVGPVAWWLALGTILLLFATVVWCLATAHRWSRAATWLLVPYALWIAYATSLNAGIIWLN